MSDVIQLDPINLTEGDSFTAEYVITDSDDNAIDLTGWEGTFDAKVNLDDATSVWSIDGVIDPDQVTNKGHILFAGTVPSPFSGKYTIRLVNTASQVNTSVAGGSDIRVYPSGHVSP